jgi:allantoin racemase
LPGCGYFSEISGDLQRELGVPVIDLAGAALKMAESLVSLGLTYSKTAYPNPEGVKNRNL